MTNLNSEYEALREEMNLRVERIHQTSLSGVAAVIAAIGFGLTGLSQNVGIRQSQVACLIQMLLILLAFYILDQNWVLYRMGTYIAYTYEDNKQGSPRWHRMSRQFGDWRDMHVKRWYRFFDRWGTAASLNGFTFLALTLANLLALFLPNPTYALSLSASAFRNFETWAVILAVITLVPIGMLVLLRSYRKQLEVDWCLYDSQYEASEFAKHYKCDLKPDKAVASISTKPNEDQKQTHTTDENDESTPRTSTPLSMT